MKIDNTMIQVYQECPLKYRERIELDWVPRSRSGALGHGGVMHEGLKAWYQGAIDGLSVASRLESALLTIQNSWPETHPFDDFRTLSRAQELMIRYASEYQTESFRVVRVEIPFLFELGRSILMCDSCGFYNLPLDVNHEPATICANCFLPLEQIEFGGIVDLLTALGPRSGTVTYIVEHKTTSVFGPGYFTQWQIHAQLTGYVWGAQQVTGKLVGGVNVNVLAMTKSGNMNFGRKMFGRNQADIDRWKNDISDTCNAIRYAQRTGLWRMHTNSCVTKFGACEFHSVHQLSDPDEQRRRLEVDYKREKWEFERRDDPATV